MRMRHHFLLLGLAGLAACSMAKSDGRFGDTGWAPTDETGQEDSADTDTGNEEPVTPQWWSLSGQVLLEGGQPVAGDASLEVVLLGEDGGVVVEICRTAFAEPTLVVESPPDPALYHWWLVTPGADDSACHSLRQHLPTSLHLGLGALHPDIAALLDQAGLGGMDPYLYGAYVQTEAMAEDGIWVYGVAATPAGWEGAQPAATEGPVPDGTYRFQPIYLLPL